MYLPPNNDTLDYVFDILLQLAELARKNGCEILGREIEDIVVEAARLAQLPEH